MRHTGKFCRAISHSWHMVRSTYYSATLTQLNLECVNCGTTRDDLWDSRGRVRRRKYKYSAHYLRLHEGGRVPKFRFRVEFINGRYRLRSAA